MRRTRNGAPRLPGIGSHHSAVPRSDDWLTPQPILDLLHPFDTDPCASIHQPTPIGVAHNWTIVDDGLTAPWEGRVWLNPPYSEVTPWMARMAVHGNGLALVFARTETRWWQEWVWPHAHSVLFLASRIAFVEGHTQRLAAHNAGGPSALIAYDFLDTMVLRGCGLAGALVTAADMLTGATVSDLLLPSSNAGHEDQMGRTHLESDDGLFEGEPGL